MVQALAVVWVQRYLPVQDNMPLKLSADHYAHITPYVHPLQAHVECFAVAVAEHPVLC
jgi:hypothetical protein